MKPEESAVEKLLRILFLTGAVIFAFIVFSALMGCDTLPARTEIQKVEVEVQVPCKAKPVDVPVWPLDSVDPAADAYTLAKVALAELEKRIAYEIELRAAVKACQ